VKFYNKSGIPDTVLEPLLTAAGRLWAHERPE
jgi:hypothetical protein